MKSIHTFAYVCKGIEGAPADQYGIHVTRDETDQPRPLATWSAEPYWALDLLNTQGVTVTIHVHFEGRQPTAIDKERVDNEVKGLTSRMLFGPG
jgi:hypothetical protein